MVRLIVDSTIQSGNPSQLTVAAMINSFCPGPIISRIAAVEMKNSIGSEKLLYFNFSLKAGLLKVLLID